MTEDHTLKSLFERVMGIDCTGVDSDEIQRAFDAFKHHFPSDNARPSREQLAKLNQRLAENCPIMSELILEAMERAAYLQWCARVVELISDDENLMVEFEKAMDIVDICGGFTDRARAGISQLCPNVADAFNVAQTVN